MKGRIYINKIVEELLTTLGYGSILVLTLIILAKYVVKPFYEMKLSENLQMKKLEQEHINNQNILLAQSKIDSNNLLHQSQLEYEGYKREKVLPRLESINEALLEHRMSYSNYLYCILNNSKLPATLEERRLKLDGIIIDNKDKILFYLPSELRELLNRIRVIVSVSWKDSTIMNGTLKSFSGIYMVDICESCEKIYKNHIECFYELVEEYISISSREKEYISILKKYNFDDEAKYIPQNVHEEIALTYILLHEYMRSEDFSEVESKVKRFNLKVE